MSSGKGGGRGEAVKRVRLRLGVHRSGEVRRRWGVGRRGWAEVGQGWVRALKNVRILLWVGRRAREL